MRDALVELLGKPIAEPTALFIPMGIYPFPAAQGGMEGDLRDTRDPLCDLGWTSIGVLELTSPDCACSRK
jgi:dipeptidase E